MPIETLVNANSDGSASTTLTAGINSTDTAIPVAATSWAPATGQFRVMVGTELILVTTTDSTHLGVTTRGIEGTTAASHSSGDSVYPILTAASLKGRSDGVKSQVWYGDGTDGSATLDGTATVTWASKASAVYSMTRDAYLTSLTINSGSQLNTKGFKVFCSGTLTNNGTIDNSGGNGGNSGGAGTATSRGTTGGSGAGGGGGTNAVGTAGGAISGFGGAGGGGGSGTNGGGAAGSLTGQSGSSAVPVSAITGALWYNSSGGLVVVSGGTGGGGGGAAASSTGGGGGAGGGAILILAQSLAGTGTISANGGNGGNGSGAGAAGGGGGGGGGFIGILTDIAVPGTQTLSVAAGSVGTGANTGNNGTAGAAGNTRTIVNT